MRSRCRAIVVVLACGALILSAQPSLARRYGVSVSGNKWSPARRTVAGGDVVVWKNNSSVRHDVSAYGGNWSKYELLDAGERTKRRFRKRGTYKFRCALHSSLSGGRCNGMCGRIKVG
jgi:plastocyanin